MSLKCPFCEVAWRDDEQDRSGVFWWCWNCLGVVKKDEKSPLGYVRVTAEEMKKICGISAGTVARIVENYRRKIVRRMD